MAQVPALQYAVGDVIDYTPGSAVAAGDVIVFGTRPLPAPSAIVANEKGVLATTGVWKIPQKAEIQTAGNPVYWDTDGDPYGGTAGTGACTATASAGYLMGTVVETTTATDQYCKVEIRGVTAQATVAGAVTADSLSITGTGGVTLAGTTGQPHVTLTTNLADALSVKDSAGDLVVVTTTTGSQAITVTPSVTFSADIVLPDDVDLALGTSSDVLIRFSDADASNHALVIAVDDTSQQLHITDKAAVATDWARSAGTHPELSIHSNTTPATDYLAIGNHDGTTAYLNVVGGTTLAIAVDGTTEASFSAAATSLPGMVSATESITGAAGSGIATHAADLVTSVEKIGTLIKTTILIDLTGLNSGANADDIIGKAGEANCHIGRIVAAVNGTIIAGKITCLEAPLGGDDDIDLWKSNLATGTEDTDIDDLGGEAKLTNGGDQALGTVSVLTALPVANDYLYLTAGTGDTNDTYTAGILLIELYGKAA